MLSFFKLYYAYEMKKSGHENKKNKTMKMIRVFFNDSILKENLLNSLIEK